MSVRVLGFGAVSAQGVATRAISAGEVSEAPRSLITRDAALASAGLARPSCARAELPEDGDRAAAILDSAARELAGTLERLGVSAPGRTLLIVGTSSGGMQSLEQAVALRAEGATIPAELARRVPYFGPLVALEPFGEHRTIQVLAACASSTLAIGIGADWLEAGYADLVIAGGYDAVSDFVAAGFEALGATSPSPRPFRIERDGLALGEGAALLALAREDTFTEAPTLGFVTGFGATSDARHVTAPDPEGRGLARAAATALRLAGDPPFELVSAHGTGTVHNDAAEARAIAVVASGSPVVQPFKAVIGHTLGAAGALEALSVLDALERGVMPAAVGEGTPVPELPGRLLSRAERGSPAVALKLSSAFGGANAALVLTRRAPEPRPARVPRSVFASRAVVVREPDLHALIDRVALPRDRLLRLDPLSSLVLVAAALAVETVGLSDRSRVGVVVGTAAATLSIDEDFELRRVRRRAEPRRFPATSPNVCAGTSAIALELGGPSLTVGAGQGASVEAVVVAHGLVALGAADAMVVVAAEDVSGFVEDVWAAARWPQPRGGAAAVVLGAEPGLGKALDRPALVAEWDAACRAPAGPDALLSALTAAESVPR